MLACLVPALLFAALYLRALDYGFVWTDIAEFQYASILRPPGRLLAAFGEPLQRADDFRVRDLQQPYYRPVQVVTASWLDARFGREPRTFRAAALVLGAATAVLFAALALGLTGSPAAALVAGCVLVAHPLGLETWVWLSGLSAALAACFVVASLLLGVNALQAHSAARRVTLAIGSLAALALGLLSKENAAVTPALLLTAALGLALEARRGGRSLGVPPRTFKIYAVALVASQTLLVLSVFLWVRPGVLGSVLSATPPVHGSLRFQISTALAHWPEAFAWLLLPLRSNTSDALRLVTTPFDPMALLGVLLPVGSALAVVALARRGRGIAAVAVCWIWIGFLPTSGLVPLLHLGAERNLFFALFGAALLWGCAGSALRRLGAPQAARVALAALLVVGLAQRTWARTPDWRSSTALFGADVANDPRHREGRLVLIFGLLGEGRSAEAKAHADVLVAQRGKQDRWWSYLIAGRDVEIHCVASETVGRDDDILQLWEADAEKRKRSAWTSPGYHECVARAFERQGRVEEALAIWRQLYAVAGRGAQAPFALAIARCETRLGRIPAAREWLERVPRDSGLDAEVKRVRRLMKRARR
jgi:hypothetical protein